MKITPELIPDVVEISIPNFEKYNPRKDIQRHLWVRLESNWWQDASFYGLSTANLCLWPVILASFAGQSSSNNVKQRVHVQFYATAIRVRKDRIKKYLSEFHNRGRIIVHNLETIGSVTLRTNERNERTKRTDENIVDTVKRESDDEAAVAAPRPKGPSPSSLVQVWNDLRGPLPAIEALSRTRAAKAKVRLSEKPDLEYWRSVMAKITASPFLRGENDRGWKATFDWLIANDTNHVKISEGRYDATASKKKFHLADWVPPEERGEVRS